MATYSVAQAKNNLPKLLDQALAGEEVVITRRGTPIAQIVAKRPQPLHLDLDWLDRVRVQSSDPKFDAGEFVRQMRDDYRY